MKNYKIKKFSEHMGISVDTIKHYQDCGILKPIINPENNYRYYNITHGERMIVSRKFRNLGFNISDTADLISCKNGIEIENMLKKHQINIGQQLQKLHLDLENVKYLSNICELFNQHPNTYFTCLRPAYYFHRHTYNHAFIEDISSELTKDLMEQLPNAVKLTLFPFDSLQSGNSRHVYHTIGVNEYFSSYIDSDTLNNMEYMPSAPAVLYIYSRQHSTHKASIFYELYNDLSLKGFQLSKEDIFIENGIDHYIDGIRYENYLIYFPISSDLK